jgi:UDP-galactopyranose mutase
VDQRGDRVIAIERRVHIAGDLHDALDAIEIAEGRLDGVVDPT